MMKKDLTNKVVNGSIWLFSVRFINRFMTLVRTVILARLLSPNDFGLMGIAILTLLGVDSFTDTGFYQALVHKKGKVARYLDAAWTMQFFRCMFLFTILFFAAAPLAAIIFKTPQASSIIRVISFAMIFQALNNIGIVYFQKELMFRKQFKFELSIIVTDISVSVILAFLLRNVWALVFGVLAGHLIRLFMSYYLHPYRPKFNFDFKKINELFHYGKWILTSAIFMFLMMQGDNIFVGAFMGATLLGFYLMAYKISEIPTTEVTNVISKVAFPAFTKISDAPARLKSAYLKILKLTAFFSFPISTLIFFLAAEITTIFLGDIWEPIILPLKVLVVAALLRSLASTVSPVFNAIGRPNLDTRWLVARLIIMALLIYPLGAAFGLAGVALAVLLGIFLSAIGYFYTLTKVTRIKIVNLLEVLVYPLASSIFMMIPLLVLKPLGHGFVYFIFLVFSAFVFWIAATLMLDVYLGYGIRPLLKMIVQKIDVVPQNPSQNSKNPSQNASQNASQNPMQNTNQNLIRTLRQRLVQMIQKIIGGILRGIKWML